AVASATLTAFDPIPWTSSERRRVSETRDSVDAGGRPESAAPQAVHVDDDERSRPAGRGESPRPAVHGPRAESTLGRRHDRVRDRPERQAERRFRSIRPERPIASYPKLNSAQDPIARQPTRTYPRDCRLT